MANGPARAAPGVPVARTIVIGFLVIWCGAALVVDVFAGLGLYWQSQTEAYASTTGELLRSNVTRTRGPENRWTTTVHLHYRYEAEGEVYESRRYNHGVGRPAAASFARGRDRGDAVTVYYDPNDPSRAVLAKGLAGGDLASILLLIPFNAFGLLLLYGMVVNTRPYGRGPAGLRQSVTREGPGLEYRPTGEVFWATIALMGGTLAAFFVLAFVDSAAAPSLDNAKRAIIGVLAAGGVGALAGSLHRLFGPRKRIVINYERRRLTVPVRGGPRTIPFEHITEVRVQNAQPVLLYQDGDDERPRLVRLPALTGNRAEELARWLRNELALPQPAGQ